MPTYAFAQTRRGVVRVSVRLWAVLVLATVGCAATPRQYDVVLFNDTSGPLTVWPTKVGGRFDPVWASPEELALIAPQVPRGVRPIVVPPGRTLEAGPLVGRFQGGSRGVLRVYAGDLDLPGLLATTRGPDRYDYPLTPGTNALRATRDPRLDHALTVEPD